MLPAAFAADFGVTEGLLPLLATGLMDKCGETGFIAVVLGLVVSSSDESPPARASNSASRSAMLAMIYYCSAFNTALVIINFFALIALSKVLLSKCSSVVVSA